MRYKCALVTVGVVLGLVGSIGFGQIVYKRILVQRPGFKVLVADDFPANLGCDIYVGAGPVPTFYAEGKNGVVTSADINVKLGTTVGVIRKPTAKEAYALILASEDIDGKVYMLFDLDLDGNWDVKKTPTRGKTQFIRLDGKWVDVEKIAGIYLDAPKAVRGAQTYSFDGTWKLVDQHQAERLLPSGPR